MTLRTKLLGSYLAFTVVGVALVSLFSSWQIKNYLDRRTEATLRSNLESFSGLMEDLHIDANTVGEFDTMFRRMSRTLGIRFTVIRKDGVVVLDSDVPADSLPRVENHLHRPEIEGARTGSIGMNRRKSATVSEEFLYAAMMLRREMPAGEDTLFVRAALPYDEIRRLDGQVQIIIWVIGLLIAVGIAMMSGKVSRRISNPILSIATTARRIGDGDLSLRIPVTSTDEIGALGRAINDMAEKLGSDIAQLRKLERVRSEFLGNVSHELRTPIFSLQGFLETLLDGAIDDPNVNRDFLEKAYRHASRLNALLGDLIEISRIESGEMKMSFRYIPIAGLLTETAEELRGAAEAKAITVSVDTAGVEKTKVYADRERLKQVLINLLDNAIKYTDAGGSVRCIGRLEGNFCAVDVQDTGIGIPSEHLSRIFERFYRVSKDRSRDVGGTGLGLAIVKHIVEAHGGVIRVVSEPSHGSSFTFTLKRE